MANVEPLAGAAAARGSVIVDPYRLNNPFRQPRAASAGSSFGECRRLSGSGAGWLRIALVLAIGVLATPAALAGWSGDRGEPLPSTKLIDDALTYSSFSGQCSQTAFEVFATGNLAVVGGPVLGPGSTTLDGLPYDTYTLTLGSGPATFSTKFDRVFAAPLPSSSYEMVFTTRVLLGNVEQGVSVTTIRCSNGVASARNQAIPSAPSPIPAGGTAAWLVLALALASAAAARLRTLRG